MKMQGILLMACGAQTAFGGTVYDSGTAFAEQFARAASSPFTDAQGATWRAGSMVSETDAAFADFTQSYQDGSFVGVSRAAGGPPPYCMMNVSSEPIGHGGDTGNMGYLLKPYELLLHPANPTQSDTAPCTAVRFEAPCTGFYRATAFARDICTGGNGVRVSIVSGGTVLKQGSLDAGSKTPVETVVLQSGMIPLKKGQDLTVVVNPLGEYTCDSTVLGFTVTEVGEWDATEAQDLGALMGAALALPTPTLPFTQNGWTIDCGGSMNSSGAMTAFPDFVEQLSPTVKGFCRGSGIPYVMYNDTGTDSPLTYAGAMPVRAGEFLMHPSDGESCWLSVTVPSNGVYAVTALLRDLGGGSYDKMSGVTAALVLNFTRQLCARRMGIEFNGMDECCLSARRLALNVGDKLILALNSLGNARADVTAVTCKVGPDPDVLADGDTLLNVDIDGRQPSDPETLTFSGAGAFGVRGQYWNSIAGVDKTVSRVELKDLRTSLKTRTRARVTIETEEGQLGFDRVDGGRNELMEDYLYTYGVNVRVTIEGLLPHAPYSICTYHGSGWGWSSGYAYLEAGGVTRTCNTGDLIFNTGSENSDGFMFPNVQTDGEGRLVFNLSSTDASAAMLLNGFQLAGEIPLRPFGLSVIIR